MTNGTNAPRDELEHLMADIRACQLCTAHLPLPPRPILQAGSQARILVVAQAPGRLAHDRGRPFDDPSGDRLRDWMGVGRATFYDPDKVALVPMGFCYPGTGRGGDLPPRPECAPAWRSPLLKALRNVALTLVIGQYAQAWHLPVKKGESLTDRVRRWRSFGPDIVPLPHPSPRNNRWLTRNPWLEAEVIPYVQHRVKAILQDNSRHQGGDKAH